MVTDAILRTNHEGPNYNDSDVDYNTSGQKYILLGGSTPQFLPHDDVGDDYPPRGRSGPSPGCIKSRPSNTKNGVGLRLGFVLEELLNFCLVPS